MVKHDYMTQVFITMVGGHFINLEDKSINKNLFIKIDVEGHEMHVLTGMKNILKKANCFLIVKTENGKHLKNITNYLKKINYSIKRRFAINTKFIKNL